ncbi:uncharacterized protein LOC100833635 [Brachypodium distachyon]|uniref:FAR1 domain-containing protein n=1 Tax=Brachypodium distachyon TaxID=15368 RepID=A0A0Q3EYB7_BRADI|nr:uncharacterized protein LOC100833635 [Brachypodium distachyon]KQJ92375.1 hypothetical protein BRADI_4g43220v3 [Brachypodium distachyon]|eukprot:XP_003578953.1 uncharacterized protein LOC100833635 [Brachypodium distachyon]
MELTSAEEEPRLGTPMGLGLGGDTMEAVRRAFPGQHFALHVVNRAFGRPDPAERSRQDSSACVVNGARASENPVDLEKAAENPGKSSAQQGSSTGGIGEPAPSEKRVGSGEIEHAGQHHGAPPAPAGIGDDAGASGTGGWRRRIRRGRIPDEREPDADRVSALEKALTGFAVRQTDVIVSPAVGTCFDSLAEAYEFYNIYSWETGFGIRYGRSRVNSKGSKCMQEITCCQGGKPAKDGKSRRCDCTALIRLLRTDDNGWYITQHRKVHNHGFSTAYYNKLQWPSHKHIDKYTRDLVRQLAGNNVNLGVYDTIASFFGRRTENVPFTKRSIRTLCGEVIREQAADDDARKTMETAPVLGEKDPENHTQEETPVNHRGSTSTNTDSVNVPADPLRYPDQGDTQINTEAGRLADLMLAFGDCHLVLKNCTYDDLMNSNGTMSGLEEAVKAVTPHLQQGIFGDLWSRAHNSGGIVSAQVLTIRDLFRFTRWLTTTTGQHNLRCVEQHVKLVKSGNGVFEPEQMALLQLYQAENDEHSREMRRLQGERDEKIAHYMAKIDEARKTFEVNVEAAKVRYPVSSSYCPLDTNELRGQCWTVYLAHCRKEAKDLNARASNIVEKYGPELLQRHLYEFCSQETNREALLKYGQTKVKKLKEAGVAQGENTLHGYMALLDIEKACALLAAEEQIANDPDTCGGGDEERRTNRSNGVARDVAAGGAAQENGSEDAPERPPLQKRLRSGQSYAR